MVRLRPLTIPGSEFWNRLSFTENWNWSTCVVSDFDSIGVYSQVSINRRQEVPYANSSFGCVLSMTIRGADNLASGDATPAEQEGHGVGPIRGKFKSRENEGPLLMRVGLGRVILQPRSPCWSLVVGTLLNLSGQIK